MAKISGKQETSAATKLPLLSVIVPVYQVKEYISECVDSLLAQTYTNLEILLIDDGSTDGSGVVCDEYAAKDGRVSVVHQRNQGLSAARNAGIGIAKGEYLAFVDSDDVTLPAFIETLYGLIIKYRADIAACAYVKCTSEEMAAIKSGLLCTDSGEGRYGSDEDGHAGRQKRGKGQEGVKTLCMTSEQMLRQWHGRYKKWETVAWNKLYRRNILKGKEDGQGMCFPIGRRHEDVLTSHLFVANGSRVAITMRKLYLYRTRKGSITDQNVTAEFREENLRAQRERMAFFKERRYWRAYLNLWVGYVLHWGWLGWRRAIGKKKSGH